MLELITQTDFLILYWIQEHIKCPFLDFLMPEITLIGNIGAVWVIAAVILFVQKKHRKTGILLLIGLFAGLLVGNVILKNAVARPRPCWIDSSVKLLISIPKDYSFPSGHTLSSVIAATILSAKSRKFMAVSIPTALLISFSRLYLFVHFPSDVIFSVLLGVIIGLSVIFVDKKFFKKTDPTSV